MNFKPFMVQLIGLEVKLPQQTASAASQKENGRGLALQKNNTGRNSFRILSIFERESQTLLEMEFEP